MSKNNKVTENVLCNKEKKKYFTCDQDPKYIVTNKHFLDNNISQDIYAIECGSLHQMEKQKLKLKLHKPFIKWVGGKTQIMDKLIEKMPDEFGNYREIFLGGGSVLLGVLSLAKAEVIHINGKVYAYDLNEALIYAFKNVQADYKKLYLVLNSIASDFYKCPAEATANRKPACIDDARLSRESYYYYIRNQYNLLDECGKKTIEGSAMFIFLNKTCFRGMYREGPNGYNVPYGNYKNPKIVDIEQLAEIHGLIQDVEFRCCDFAESLGKVQCNDFVYMDPPYVPETKASFVGYTSHGFTTENHMNLFSQIHKMCKKENIKIMLCNSDVGTVRESFSDPKYNVTTLLCRRSINSKKPESMTNELLITNYTK